MIEPIRYTGHEPAASANEVDLTPKASETNAAKDVNSTQLNAANNIKTSDDELQSFVEGEVDISKYTTSEQAEIFVSSLDSNTKTLIKESLKEQVNSMQTYLDNVKAENGAIGSLWDGFKNLTGLGAGSKKAQAQIDALMEKIKNADEDDLAALYKDLTGNDLTPDELQKYITGESSVYNSDAALAVLNYEQGQAACVDTVADIASGIVAFGCYSLALGGAIAAPFTGGASLGVTAAAVGLASAGGAATKIAVKGLDSAIGGREYTLSDAGKDGLSGAINGPLAAATAGIGYGVSKIGARLGITAAQTAVQTAESRIVVGFGKTVAKDAANVVFQAGVQNGVIGLGDDAVRTMVNSSAEEFAQNSMRYAFSEANNQALRVVATDTFGQLGTQSAINQAQNVILSTAANSAAQNSAMLMLDGTTKSAASSLVERLAFKGVQGSVGGASMGALSSGAEYLIETDMKDWNAADLADTMGAGALGGAAVGGVLGVATEGVSIIKENVGKNAPQANIVDAEDFAVFDEQKTLNGGTKAALPEFQALDTAQNITEISVVDPVSGSVIMIDPATGAATTQEALIAKSLANIQTPIQNANSAGVLIGGTQGAQTLIGGQITPSGISDNPLQSRFSNLKPSEFSNMLNSRTDIEEKIKAQITTPEKLALYDELSSALADAGVADNKRAELLKTFISKYNDASAELEVLPSLIRDGYDPELLSKIQIKDYNKNQIRFILDNQDRIDASADVYIQNEMAKNANAVSYSFTDTDEDWGSAPVDYEAKREEYKAKMISNILKYLDDNNVQYFDECMDITHNNPSLLPLWQEDTAEIYTSFLQTNFPITENSDTKQIQRVLDILSRRNHTTETVAAIAADGEIDSVTQRLLEFRSYDKFKNIDTSNFDTLSVEDKKEFLNSFISSITSSDILWDKNMMQNFGELSSRMKIFAEIESTDRYEMLEKYQDTIRTLLDKIPESERQPISTPISHGEFMADYRSKNPIPSLVEDISTLDYTIETFEGKEYKVITLDSRADIEIATHGFPEGGILNIEALEITDPNQLLCIGLKDKGGEINFYGNEYSLAVKPRLADDWWIQSSVDIDSGTGAQKNMHNVDRYCLRLTPSDRTVEYIPELLKKELDLSEQEYTHRMETVKDCRTLDEIGAIDPELEAAIRKVSEENHTFEGLIRPEVMGICVDSVKPLSEISPDILAYCERHDIPLIMVENSSQHDGRVKKQEQEKLRIEKERAAKEALQDTPENPAENPIVANEETTEPAVINQNASDTSFEADEWGDTVEWIDLDDDMPASDGMLDADAVNAAFDKLISDGKISSDTAQTMLQYFANTDETTAKQIITKLFDDGFIKNGGRRDIDKLRATDATIERLQRTIPSVEPDSLVSLLEKTDFDFTTLAGQKQMNSAYPAGLILSTLIDKGILSEDTLLDVTGTVNFNAALLSVSENSQIYDLVLRKCGTTFYEADGIRLDILYAESSDDIKNALDEFTKYLAPAVQNQAADGLRNYYSDNLTTIQHISELESKLAGTENEDILDLLNENSSLLNVSDISAINSACSNNDNFRQYVEDYISCKKIMTSNGTVELDSEQIKTSMTLIDKLAKGEISTDILTPIMEHFTELDRANIDAILAHYGDNSYYTPQEYVENFLYFKNLKTDDGIGIFDAKELSDKTAKYSNMITSISLNYSNNIAAMLNVNPSSVDASYMQTLIELIQRGEVNSGALQCFVPSAEYLGINTGGSWALSNEIKADIDKMYEVIVNNSNSENIHKEMMDAFIPTVSDIETGLEQASIGDVFKLDSEDFIRIKTSDTTSALLSISKETYYDLFPPTERFATVQQALNDCYCIENMMTLYSDVNERANVLKMFSENSDGNLIVNLPNSSAEIILQDGDLPEIEHLDVYSNGAKGFRILEYAFAKSRMEDNIQAVKDSLSGSELVEFLEFVEQNGSNIYIYNDFGHIKWMTYEEAEKTLGIQGSNYGTFGATLIGNMGLQPQVLEKMGYDYELYIHDYRPLTEEEVAKKRAYMEQSGRYDTEEIEKHITALESVNPVILKANNELIEEQMVKMGVSKDKINKMDEALIEQLQNPDFYKENIVQMGFAAHAYSLTCEINEFGEVAYYLYDPYHQATPAKITDLEKFLFEAEGSISTITIAKRKD